MYNTFQLVVRQRLPELPLVVALKPSKRLVPAPTPDSQILVLLKLEDLTAANLETHSCCSTTGNGEIKLENNPFCNQLRCSRGCHLDDRRL